MFQCLGPDGRPGRSVDAVELARRLGPDDPQLARELAFLADALPSWADPARTCPCGAPASVQRRLVAASFVDRFAEENDDALPVVLNCGPDEDHPEVAEVVAVGCDRHLRFLAASELERMGLELSQLRSRLELDRGQATFRARVGTVEAMGMRALWVRGPYAASIIMEDGWAASLAAAADAPIAAGEAHLGLALGPDVAVMVEVGVTDDARSAVIASAARQAGLSSPRGGGFVVSVEVDLRADPVGKLDRG